MPTDDSTLYVCFLHGHTVLYRDSGTWTKPLLKRETYLGDHVEFNVAIRHLFRPYICWWLITGSRFAEYRLYTINNRL